MGWILCIVLARKSMRMCVRLCLSTCVCLPVHLSFSLLVSWRLLKSFCVAVDINTFFYIILNFLHPDQKQFFLKLCWAALKYECQSKTDSCVGIIVVSWLNMPATCKVFLKDRFVWTSLITATLTQKLQIQLAVSPSHSMLTAGQPVLALTLQSQTAVRADTREPVFNAQVWLNLQK